MDTKVRTEAFYKQIWRKISHGVEVPPKVVSDGKQVLLDSLVAGDEPYILAKNLPGVVVLCDKNRVRLDPTQFVILAAIH